MPNVEVSQNVYSRVFESYVNSRTRWLDLGCGHQTWPDWIPGQEEKARRPALFVGLDPDIDSLRNNKLVHYRVVGLQLPFRDESFNLVTANMVFEHLENPVSVLNEIRRVLSPGGVCVFHTPNALYWQIIIGRHFPQWLKNKLIRLSESREEKDIYPTYYRINTEQSIRALIEEADFQAENIMMLNTSSAGRILLLGPFFIFELLWIRLTQHPALKRHRTNIIAVIRPCKILTADLSTRVDAEAAAGDLFSAAGKLEPHSDGVRSAPVSSRQTRN